MIIMFTGALVGEFGWENGESMIELLFLGTGAGKPTLERSLSGIIVRSNQTTILLDCGETTQTQLMRSGISPMKIDLIIITHLHGDHFFGLPGLLQTMDLLHRQTPITIICPKGIQIYLECVQQITTPLTYPLTFRTIKSHQTYEHRDLTITHVKANHSIESYVTSTEFRFKTGRFLPQKALERGIPQGPLWRELKEGKDISLENGEVIYPSDVTEPAPPPIKIVYSSDTAPCQELRDIAQEATVLIHDSTYQSDDKRLAEIAYHSTAEDAAQLAQRVHAQYLFLTHISPRYKESTQMLQEAQAIFQNTRIPDDLSHYRVTVNKKERKIELIELEKARDEFT